ncbi:bifunctional diguanylate cyclase/phosphodiesterase [Ferrimonas balearica]|uniref:bifunctional diguanylate cyclase/phosphodiesterase n=1 Tax=Ferrimonas balearica TaxID=44012 RepID=UPI001C59BDD7|nr:EAL domain-containing protein [Ferrimonas balearica]MBW3165683.1 EAL domain-containing protein [Ferrimonas balearica]
MLFQIAQLAAQASAPHAYCQAIIDLLATRMPGKNGFVALADEDGPRLLWAQDRRVSAPPESLRHGLTDLLLKRGRSMFLHQVEISSMLSRGQIRLIGALPDSWMGVVLEHEDKVIGALVVQSYEKERYCAADLALLDQLAPYIAQGLTQQLRQRPSLGQGPERSDRILSVLYRITELSQSNAPLLELYGGFHQLIGELLMADNFYVALLDDSGKQLHFPYSCDDHSPVPEARPLGRGATEYLLKLNAPVLLNYQQMQTLADEGEIELLGRTSQCWLGAPLSHDGVALGALVLQDYNNPIAYGEEELKLIGYLAHHIAGVIRWRRAAERLTNNQQALEQAVLQRTQALEHEINERRRIESQLRHDALHDELTTLPNRSMIMQRLHQVLSIKARDPNFHYALLFLDLNRFKVINDSLGHLTGDRLLAQVAHRLSGCVRGSDTVARLGGDEFAILLEHLSCDNDALQSAERIQAVLAKPFYIDGEEIYSGTSIGIAFGLSQYQSPVELLRDADVAMYRAKQAHRAAPVVFDNSMREAAQHRMKLENELQRALELNQFEVHYQPVWNLASEQLVGFEALVRWRHPERGLLLPGEFIELMEETHQILPLDRWVLNQACHQFAQWQRKYPRLARVGVSVNLSSEWFNRADSLDVVMQSLKQSGLSARSLLIEITERSLLHQPDQAASVLRQLRRLGIKLMMDDFGTGYSSLSYLHRLPLDVVKVDRSFISRLHEDQRAEAVISAILNLASALGMKVNAEGIDNPKQVAMLKQMGCQYGQGYQLGRPLPAERVSDFLAGKSHTR